MLEPEDPAIHEDYMTYTETEVHVEDGGEEAAQELGEAGEEDADINLTPGEQSLKDSCLNINRHRFAEDTKDIIFVVSLWGSVGRHHTRILTFLRHVEQLLIRLPELHDRVLVHLVMPHKLDCQDSCPSADNVVLYFLLKFHFVRLLHVRVLLADTYLSVPCSELPPHNHQCFLRTVRILNIPEVRGQTFFTVVRDADTVADWETEVQLLSEGINALWSDLDLIVAHRAISVRSPWRMPCNWSLWSSLNLQPFSNVHPANYFFLEHAALFLKSDTFLKDEEYGFASRLDAQALIWSTRHKARRVALPSPETPEEESAWAQLQVESQELYGQVQRQVVLFPKLFVLPTVVLHVIPTRLCDPMTTIAYKSKELSSVVFSLADVLSDKLLENALAHVQKLAYEVVTNDIESEMDCYSPQMFGIVGHHIGHHATDCTTM